jgi:hypothetical protein
MTFGGTVSRRGLLLVSGTRFDPRRDEQPHVMDPLEPLPMGPRLITAGARSRWVATRCPLETNRGSVRRRLGGRVSYVVEATTEFASSVVATMFGRWVAGTFASARRTYR